MASSKVVLANLSLTQVGARRISSFSEATAEARAVNATYDDIRDEVLEEAAWTFAQKRVALATVDITPAMVDDGCDVVYAKPADFISLNEVNYPSALIKIEGNYILSDTSGLKIKYTYQNDDPTKYSKKFTNALATRLAAALCFALTESANKAEMLMKMYIDILLPGAVAADSKQGSPIQAIQDSWENVRLGGSNQFATVGQTWHPI